MQREVLLKQIYNRVLKADKIFVQAHANCGDAAGSTLAMAHWLKSLHKDFLAFSPAPIPDSFLFLPGVEEIVSNPNDFDLSDFDLFLILDCGDMGRTGIEEKIKQEKESTAIIINIDHHYTNNNFGDINFVDKSAPSTTTLIHEFMTVNNIEINKNIATCLLCGIFTDTGIFTNPATNQEALAKASDLLVAGASVNSIISSIFKNRSFISLKLWGRALERLVFNSEYSLAYTVLLQEDFREFGADSEEEVEGLANFLNHLSDAKVSLVLRETRDGKIKGSFRTVSDLHDVGKLAGFFGGGGHKKASGFTIDGIIRYNENDRHWEVF